MKNKRQTYAKYCEYLSGYITLCVDNEQFELTPRQAYTMAIDLLAATDEAFTDLSRMRGGKNG